MARKTKQSPATSADVSPVLPLPAAVSAAVNPPAPPAPPAPLFKDAAQSKAAKESGAKMATADLTTDKAASAFRAAFAVPGITFDQWEALAAVWRQSYMAARRGACSEESAVTAFGRCLSAAQAAGAFSKPKSVKAGSVKKAADREADRKQWEGKTLLELADARTAALRAAADLVSAGKVAESKESQNLAKSAERAMERKAREAKQAADAALSKARERVRKLIASATMEQLAKIEAIFAAPPVTGSVGAELQKIA